MLSKFSFRRQRYYIFPTCANKSTITLSIAFVIDQFMLFTLTSFHTLSAQLLQQVSIPLPEVILKIPSSYRVDNMLLWFYPCQCSLYRILCPVASVTMACDFCENCDFCDFKFRTFSSFRSMRTLFLASYFSVIFLLNSLNCT